MPGRQPAWRLAVGTLVAAIAFSAAAWAQGSKVDLLIDCPALDEASHAALEARSRAELTSAPLPPGGVRIRCSGEEATLVWRPSEGIRRQSVVRIGTEPSAAVEIILGALDLLLFEKPASDAASASPSAPAPAPAPASAPASSPSPSPSPANVPPAQVAHTSEQPEPPQIEALAPHLASSYGFGFAGGGDAELWSGAVAGGVGFHAAVYLASPRRWSVVLGGGALWPTASPQSIHAQVARAYAGLGYNLVSHVILGAAADARFLFASQGSLSDSQTTAGLVVSVRYAANLGAFRLSFGPQGELLIRPVIVEEAGSEVFRMPNALVGFAMEASGDLTPAPAP